LPAELFRNPPPNRKPQAVSLGLNRVQPRKRRKQPGLIFSRDAGAVIAHPKTHQAIRLRLCKVVPGNNVPSQVSGDNSLPYGIQQTPLKAVFFSLARDSCES
jgi:hypothetical protein